jgi:hypothetical protein
VSSLPEQEAFDAALRDRIRLGRARLTLVKTAQAAGFEHAGLIAMPANNHSVVSRKR